jgi:hypothetical protein
MLGLSVLVSALLATSVASAAPRKIHLENSPDTDLLQAKLFNVLAKLSAKSKDVAYDREEPWGEETYTVKDAANVISCRADYGESIGGQIHDTHYSCSLELSDTTFKTAVAATLYEALTLSGVKTIGDITNQLSCRDVIGEKECKFENP